MQVVVSLTVISTRLKRLHRVLETILGQTRPPDRVCLWISSEPYLLDEGVVESHLPRAVRDLVAAGRVDVATTENIGPHRKAVPLLREIASDATPPLIVTADDDVLYPQRWLEELLQGHARHPEAIVCFRARKITCGEHGLAPYRDWVRVDPGRECLGKDMLVTGTGGMLMHRDHLDLRVLGPEFATITPSRSDAWLGGAYLSRGTPVLKLSLDALVPDPTGLKILDGELPPAYKRRRGIRRALLGRREQRRTALHNHNRFINDETLSRAFAYYGVDPRLL